MLPFNLLLSCAEALMAHDVFISYSSKDKPPADATCAKLEARGIRCWIAPRDIQAGENFGKAIVRAIRACKVFVVVFSAAANASPNVRREVERALDARATIIPFRIEDVGFDEELEFWLSLPQWLNAFEGTIEANAARLITDLSQILGKALPASTEPPEDAPEHPTPKKGDDLHDSIMISGELARSGGSQKVALSGEEFDLEVPAGSTTGTKVRIVGKGKPSERGDQSGDIVFELLVLGPTR